MRVFDAKCQYGLGRVGLKCALRLLSEQYSADSRRLKTGAILEITATFEMDYPSQRENGSELKVAHASQVTLVHTKSGGKNRHWSVFEKVLLALVLIFFVGFIVFVALYANKLSDDNNSDNGNDTDNGNDNTRGIIRFLLIAIRNRERNSLG